MITYIFRYFDPKPNFFYFDNLGGTVCHIKLPSNAPIHQIAGAPHFSMEAAKRDACLKAIEELHKLGALTDCLLPKQDDRNPEELVSDGSDSGLYDVLVSAAAFFPLTFFVIGSMKQCG